MVTAAIVIGAVSILLLIGIAIWIKKVFSSPGN